MFVPNEKNVMMPRTNFRRNVLVLGLLGLALTALSQTNREQLNQYVADLQKNPSDGSLREKIIKIALTITPKLTAPPEADEQSGRASYAFKDATSESDFVAAADSYAKA